MNQTERINYHITGYSFTEISKGKGSIEYQLTDDFGNERLVTAMANINIFKKISSVRPIYHRELPLISALAQKELNDTITVDFSEYNRNNPRSGSMRKNNKLIPNIKIKKTGGASLFSDQKMRLFPLLFLGFTGFILVTYLFSNI